MPLVEVYSDGSSHARGGKPGGWAFVVLLDGKPFRCGYGGDPSTTNNVMELTGAIMGLRWVDGPFRKRLEKYADARVVLVSDSQYVLGLADGSNSPKKNLALADELFDLATRLSVATRWVRGHTGDPWNERCDRLAKRGKEEAMSGT